MTSLKKQESLVKLVESRPMGAAALDVKAEDILTRHPLLRYVSDFGESDESDDEDKFENEELLALDWDYSAWARARAASVPFAIFSRIRNAWPGRRSG